MKRNAIDRLAQRDHGLDQFFLAADEVKAGAVAHVLQRPGLARGLLVAADGQHNHVGLLRDFNSLGNLLAVFFRIARDHLILVPVSADGDFATFAIEDLDFLAGFLADAVENRDIVPGHAAVTAKKAAMRIGTDDGDGFDFAEIERRDVVFVFEQRDGLVRGGKSQFAVGIAADHALSLIGIDIGIVEQAHFELPEKHGRDQFVEIGLFEHAFADKLDEMQVAIGIGQLDIHAGFDRERAGFLLVRGDASGRAYRDGSRVPRWRSNRKRRSP